MDGDRWQAEPGVPTPPKPAWPVGQQRPVPLPDHAPAPPSAPAKVRGRGRLVAAAALSAVAAVVLTLLAADRYSQDHGPQAVVRSYFHALANGNAPGALAFADAAPKGQFLTSQVLRQQLGVAALTDVSLGAVTEQGDTATVDVRYRLGFAAGARQVQDRAQLIRRGSSWRLSKVASTVTVGIAASAVNWLAFADQAVPKLGVLVFPGALPLAAGNPSLKLAEAPSVRLRDVDVLATAQLQVTARLRAEIATAVDRDLAGCLSAGSSDPLCPVPQVSRPVPGSLRGTPSRTVAEVHPAIELDPSDAGLVTVRAEVPIKGSWKVWNFENQAVQRRGSIIVALQAQVSLSQPAAVFWQLPKSRSGS